MFKAVRDSSTKAGALFRGRRLRRTARLFVFEFVVVLLGVLAAQMLQNFVAERRSRGDAAFAYDQLRQNIANLKAIAYYWDRSAPCLIDHVERIAEAASAGRMLPANAIGRPALPTPEFTEWTEPTRAAVERRYGPQVVADHDAVGQQAEIILGFNREIASDWSAFPLLDERLGTASAEDQANVRLAAARALTQLRMQRFKVIEIRRVGDRYAVAPSADDTNDYRSITNNCGLLKNW
jgi:hypothetical protein